MKLFRTLSICVLGFLLLNSPCLGQSPTFVLQCEGRLSDLAISPDGKTIAGARGKKIDMWDAVTGKKKATLDYAYESFPIMAIAFLPDSNTLVGGSYYGSVVTWDLKTSKETWIGQHRHCIVSIGVSPDGQTVATTSYDLRLKVWDLKEKKERFTLRPAARTNVIFTPDGRSVVAGHSEGKISFWDSVTGKLEKTLEHDQPFGRICFFPDGKMLAFSDAKDEINIFDIQRGIVVARLGTQKGKGVCSLVMDKDGDVLASAGDDGTIQVWDAKKHELRRTLHGSPFGNIVLSRNGTIVASSGKDSKVSVWKLK